MSRDDIVRAARSAMARARALTAGTRAASDNTLNTLMARVMAAEQRRCEKCSGRIHIGPCTCQVRCTAADCPQTSDRVPDDEASIP